MPVLQFKGKNTIWNYHLAVPYHTLDPVEKLDYNLQSSSTGKPTGNLIIEGDNLLALKALLPQYSGRIKCICIDPPYNTGEEKWVYNDNVNHPMFKAWLGQAVGKDDLTRHDKWLCMISPRLKLLYQLLHEEGALFINIEDNEYQNLKAILGEIFGEDNFVGNFIWRKKEGGGQTKEYFVTEHEYIVVYRKTEKFIWGDDSLGETDADYHFEDANGKYKTVKLAKWGNTARKEDRPKMYFPIAAPDGTKVIPYAPDGNPGRWRVGKARMNLLIESDLVEFKKDTKDKWAAYEKVYFEENDIKTIKERSILYDLTNTADASRQLTELFGKKDVFDTPKPLELVKYFLSHATQKDDIVLDSFAGSGTTMQAVMELNKEDGGNRTCIMVQMTEATQDEPKKNICKDITRERIKRAIDKYQYQDGFRYLKVGIAIDAETMLAGNLPAWKQLAEYVYYLCTGTHLKDKKNMDEKAGYVGGFSNAVIYLVYKKDSAALPKMAITLDLAKIIVKANPKKRIIVYAPSCFLEESFMEENQIEFVGIPYDLFKRTGS
jgi:adenine-specific DNA-methyltransferase